MLDTNSGPTCVCAAVHAGGEQLSGVRFPLVVLDEGSQCSEPESLIPLAKASLNPELYF